MTETSHDVGHVLDLSLLATPRSSKLAREVLELGPERILACDTAEGVARFVAARDALPSARRVFLESYSIDEYTIRGARLFITADAQGGFGLIGTQLISLFSYPGRGYGAMLIEEAKRLGANYLTCYDTDGSLVRFYRLHGFEEVSRARWESALAPRNWNYELFGRPDFVEMSL